MMADSIIYEQHGDVVLLKLDDGKANAFSFAFIEHFNALLDRAAEDARVVAVQGRPGVLSGGFDLGVIRSGDEDAIKRLVTDGARLMMRLYGHPQPVLVGATGHAVALGAFMLLAADYRVGTAGDFKVGLNETAIGLELPQFGIELATARLSRRHLTRATLGATLYTPADACDIGFLDEVAEPDDLSSCLLERAAAMAELDSKAFAASKVRMRGPAVERILNDLS